MIFHRRTSETLAAPRAERPVSPTRWLAAYWSSGIPQRALAVALIVGTVLNIINQGDVIARGGLNWPKAILTYLVPFAVSTHGALSARREPK